jgi:arginine/ornithine transport system substrate-binding protein
MKIFAGLLAAIALCFPLMASAGDTLRIGIDPTLPPFVSMNKSNHPEGFDIDIALAMCEELKTVCEFVPMGWDGLIPALQTKKIDTIISSMSITEPRLKVINFTRSYYKTNSQLFMREGLTSPVGHTIGVLRGSTDENYARDVLQPQGVKVIAYTSQQEAFLDAANTRLDGVLGPQIEVDYGFIKRPEGKGFAPVGQPIVAPEYYGPGVGMAVRKADTKQLEDMNRAIETIHSNGLYQKINKKHFEFDIWGE